MSSVLVQLAPVGLGILAYFGLSSRRPNPRYAGQPASPVFDLVDRMFPRAPDGRVAVALPDQGIRLAPSQHIRMYIYETADIASGVAQRLATQLTARPTGPTGVDPRHSGGAPGH